MDRWLATKIYRDFSHLFPEAREDYPIPISLFGLEVGNGWFPLLYFTLRWADEICIETGGELILTQIKEKFGLLQIHSEWLTDDIDDLFESAEETSALICEICGRPGKSKAVSGRWIITRCEVHGEGGKIGSEQLMRLMASSQVFVCNIRTG